MKGNVVKNVAKKYVGRVNKFMNYSICATFYEKKVCGSFIKRLAQLNVIYPTCSING